MNARRKRTLPPWARWVVGISLFVIALNLLIGFVGNTYGTPGGPTSSSFATGPDGAAAYAELLARSGHPVAAFRDSFDDELPPARTTLVVLDPGPLTESDVSTLHDWVLRGGRLVIGGDPETWSSSLLDHVLVWSQEQVVRGVAIADVPETAEVTLVTSEGQGSWADTGGALPVVGTTTGDGGTLVAVATLGEGRAVLIADTSLLHNRLLDEDDNAALGLAAAGPTSAPVYFAEGVHGYTSASGLGAIPYRWKVALLGLALAAIVWMVAIGRRMGPPEPIGRVLPPPRRAYLEALATTLARTKRGGEAVAPLRATARRTIATRAGIARDDDVVALEGAARQMGLTDHEIAATLGGDAEVDVIAVGRALAKLGGRGW